MKDTRRTESKNIQNEKSLSVEDVLVNMASQPIKDNRLTTNVRRPANDSPLHRKPITSRHLLRNTPTIQCEGTR